MSKKIKLIKYYKCDVVSETLFPYKTCYIRHSISGRCIGIFKNDEFAYKWCHFLNSNIKYWE